MGGDRLGGPAPWGRLGGWLDAWLKSRLAARRGWLWCGLLAGAMTALAHAPLGLYLLGLLGYALLFGALSVVADPRGAARLGWAAGLGHFALTLSWIIEPFLVDIARHGWMAPFALVLMAGGLALFWGLAAWAAHRITDRAGPAGWRRSAALVLALTLAEALRSYIFTGFPWALVGHGLIGGVIPSPLLQLAAYVGPHGLSAVMLTLGAALWGLTRPRRGMSVSVSAAVLGLALLAGVWGAMRGAATAVPTGPDAPVIRMVQPNAPQHLKWNPEHIPIFYNRMIEATRAAPQGAGPAPDLIVWPETALPVLLERAEAPLAQISEAAQGLPVFLGVQRFDGPKLMNSAVLLGAGGQVRALYDKHHLVPFGEYVPLGDLLAEWGIHGLAATEGMGYSPGPGAALIELPGIGPALPLICYEAIFPQDVAAAPERPRLLLQITNDAWFGALTGPYQHLAQARLRAVEQGLPMLRVANTGVSAMIDARGQITAQLPLNTTGWLDAALPAPLPPTAYARLGDLPFVVLFALCFAGLALVSRQSGVDRGRGAD